MQKHLLTVIAGTAAVVLAGCYNPNKVVIQRKYKPAPEQPAPIADNMSEPKELAPGSTGTVKTAEYEPMTDAVPTGGVDSVDAKNASPQASSSSGTYIVKKGDTLGRIARRHKVKLSALMAANNMDEQAARRLRIGTKLVIPAGGKASAVSNGSKEKSAKAEKNAPAPAVTADGKYTIKSGDTPERIARRFKIKLNDLMKANNMDEQAARKLQIGQQLVIPGREAAPAPVAPPIPTVTEKAPEEKVSVTIEDVASVKDASTTPVKTEDSISDTTNSAEAVEVIEVTSDTTMEKFAAEKNISVEKLRSLNKDKSENLAKGTWLLVPQK